MQISSIEDTLFKLFRKVAPWVTTLLDMNLVTTLELIMTLELCQDQEFPMGEDISYYLLDQDTELSWPMVLMDIGPESTTGRILMSSFQQQTPQLESEEFPTMRGFLLKIDLPWLPMGMNLVHVDVKALHRLENGNQSLIVEKT